MHANKVNEPILLIHGEEDNNSGTFPIQSVRFFNAIKGHGGTSKLVMLPKVSRYIELKNQFFIPCTRWTHVFEKYVKNKNIKPDDINVKINYNFK